MKEGTALGWDLLGNEISFCSTACKKSDLNAWIYPCCLEIMLQLQKSPNCVIYIKRYIFGKTTWCVTCQSWLCQLQAGSEATIPGLSQPQTILQWRYTSNSFLEVCLRKQTCWRSIALCWIQLLRGTFASLWANLRMIVLYFTYS